MLELGALVAVGMWLWFIADAIDESYFRHRRPTRAAYRKSLRRFCQRRYIRNTRLRQQIRALEFVAWQMRQPAGTTVPPLPVFNMPCAGHMEWFHVPGTIQQPRRRLADIIGTGRTL